MSLPAFGTITLSGALLGDTVTVGDATFTADTLLSTTPATGTITCFFVLNGNRVGVAGVVFTADTSQDPGQQNFDQTGSNADTALSLAAAINDPTNGVSTTVSAVAVGNVVTLTAAVGGTVGDLIALASANPNRLIISGSTLTGGASTFDATGTDEAAALSLATAINDSANGIDGLVVAGTGGGTSTVNLLAVTPGVAGNQVVLATSADTRIVLSGSAMGGGFEAGAEYGYSPYGSMPFPRPPYPPMGGYGGAAYGYAPYGSVETITPRVTGAVSLNGTQIELFFSEEMDPDPAVLCEPTNYTITAIIGVPTVTVLQVDIGTEGPAGGATSVILTHTGTTLGGNYEVAAFNITDWAGNPIDELPTNKGRCLTFGDTPTYTVTPIAGDVLQVQFSEDMAPETLFTPGVEDINAYGITTTYPIPLTVLDAEQQVDPSIVNLTVQGMTSASYDIEIAPADAIDYDGSVLPDADPGFAGIELGTGSSTILLSRLVLNKAVGSFYGWSFGDTSGRLLPSSTYRMDVAFDASAAVYSPGLYDATAFTVQVSDGTVQVDLAFTRVAGIDVIDVTSGAFSMQVPADWSSGPITVTLLRNQLADHYALLINGTPVVADFTASFTGAPTIPTGATFILTPLYTVSGFVIESLKLTSTQTVFSALWNFLHGVSSSFTGGTALTRDHLLTERGPLVKGWGDATPATTQDVEVRINGVVVPLADVNPYMGKVFPTIPIPLTPPGTATVEVDYKWFPSPIMTMGTLNTEGLILNKYDQPNGHTHPSTNPNPASSPGVADMHRFPMGVVLGPMARQSPIQIGHRYIGYEREYTAALNSPTTLLLNQNPRMTSQGGFSRTPEPVSVSYDGSVVPPSASKPWTLFGVDTGSVIDDDTIYQVIDDSAGSFEVGDAALYVREEDMTFPSTVNMTVRAQVLGYTADGVFTGVGFGTHDNYRLYMAGFLLINDVRHLGFLTNPERPDLQESWELGPSIVINITGSLTFEVPTDELPTFITDESRFQIFEGAQAGVYQIAECGIVHGTDGTTTITLDPSTPFPADPNEFGNQTPTAVFEVPWDAGLISYRMLVDPDQQTAQVYVGGTLSTPSLDISVIPAVPARTSLLLPTGEKGMVFWGSVSRIATNVSNWTFVQYTIQPDMTSFHSTGIVVAAEMSVPPDEDANNPWFLTNEFGLGEIDSSGDTLLLKSTSESPDESLDLTFGYARVEPFLEPPVAIDLDATFRLDSTNLGADSLVLIRDGTREIRFATIAYRETGGVRSLVYQAVDSISGLRDPLAEGWTQTATWGLDTSVRQNKITITQALGEGGRYRTDMTLPDGSGSGRIAEATFAVGSYTANGFGQIGPYFSTNADTGGGTRRVGVTLLESPARVALVDSSGVAINSFAFDWTDGAFHTYRITVQPGTDTITVFVNDTLLGTETLSSFATVTTGAGRVTFGVLDDTTASQVQWDAFSVQSIPSSVTKYTLGVFLGGDETDINNWELPRTDSLSVSNSDLSAVIEEMDWRSDVSVRIRRDPDWGVTVFRPDLPLPPYYDPDGQTTPLTNPSEGWINVETRSLPRHVSMFGQVAFGALDPQAVSQQRWGQVRYRIYKSIIEGEIAPHHMVLNQYNVITSGEFNIDTTPEVVTVTSLSRTLVALTPSHIFADRVFNVVVDGSVLPSSSWTFDEASQSILLDPSVALPTASYPVTVTFAPGKPITKTYLCSQPVEDSITLLNQGTPPVPKSQMADAIRELVFGSQINDPNDTLNDDPDFILNDPYRTVQFTDDPESLYECMEFCEVNDGGALDVLSIACDGPAPESGWVEMALEGIGFSDAWSRPYGPAAHPGSPVIGETAGPFSHESILHVSGGTYVDGVLGPGSAVLYRNRVGPDYRTGSDMAVLNREIDLRMRMSSVTTGAGDTPLEDTFDPIEDNVPPSAVSGDVVPDGTPGATGNGAVAAQTSDPGSNNSVLGPWGGLAVLQTQSRLAGGQPLDGSELILNTPKSAPVVSSFQIEAAN